MTMRPGSAVMFALIVLVAGCTADPGATVSTVGSDVITTSAASAPEPSGPESFDEFVESGRSTS
jgi:hypothetical protein